MSPSPHAALDRTCSEQATVIQSLAAFDALENDWQSLLQASGTGNIHLDHRWLREWLVCRPQAQPFIVTVRDAQGRLMGAAPFKISRGNRGLMRRLLRQVQFIGSEPYVYDWMQILCHPQADPAQLLGHVAEQLLEHQARWDVIQLNYQREAEQLLTLRQALAQNGRIPTVKTDMTASYLPLPESFSAFEQAMKKNMKSNLRRRFNRLREDYPKQTLTLATYPAGQPETEAALEQLFDAHTVYWQARGIRSNFERYPALRRFYQTLYRHYGACDNKADRMALTQLKLGEAVLSTMLGFWQGSAFSTHILNYNPRFKKYDPGMLHYWHLIQQIIAQGGRGLDFGRGDEAYKSRWTDEQIPLWSLLHFKTGYAAWLWGIDTQLGRIRRRVQGWGSRWLQRDD